MTTVGTATPGAAWFLNGVANLQQEQIQTTRQLTSGYRVQDASDAPALAPELVSLGSALASVQSYQANLNRVQTEAQSADSALGAGISLLENAQSIAVQGAGSTVSAATRQSLAIQVQNIQQQVVSLANTSVAGRFIFGGASDQSAPYQYDAAATNGADKLTAQGPGAVLVDPQGQTVFQGLSAQQVFDATDANGVPTSGNIFAALQSLSNSLNANDQAGISNALSAVRSASDFLNQQQATYGAGEKRITEEQNTAANHVTSLQTAIGGIRDTNVAQAAADLSRETVDQSAAYGAESLISRKSLFDYIG